MKNETKGLVKLITGRGLRTGYSSKVFIGGVEIPMVQKFSCEVHVSADEVVSTLLTLRIAGDEVVEVERRDDL